VDTEQANFGPIKIIVCIKQVPLLSALRFDAETRRLVREGVPLDVNELDIYALTEAVRLRTLYGGEVIAITMGPLQAHEALATALAIGADRAIHLSDRAFGGADTYATAYTLALAIAPERPDLIFCGRHSIDAETSQVGPEIAEMLALPQISAIQKIDLRKRDGNVEIIATRETDEGNETLSVLLPALVTAAERLNDGIWPNEQEIRTASQQSERYQVITAAELSVDISLLGQKGSPTWVSDFEPDALIRESRMLAHEDPLKLVELLVNDLEEHGFLDIEQLAQSEIQRHSATSQRLGEPLPGKAVWVIAESSPHGLRKVSLELLGKGIELAARLQGELVALLIGGTENISEHAASLTAYGAERVYVAADPALERYTTDAYAAVLSEAISAKHPAVVLLGSTANGRDLAPRVAARLKLGLTGDCVDLAVDDQQRLIQYKPAFGNQFISRIRSNTLPAMSTLRPGMLHAAEPDFTRTSIIEHIPTSDLASHIRTRIITHESREVGVEELESAQIILGVGMGMGEPENYPLVYQLAALLDAAIGSTRNVADNGWLPKQTQIGLTGRAIAPQLYLALGVRGAAEHIAGIRKAGYVVSINKNKRAAIFRHSDVGIVGDIHTLLPLLLKQLEFKLSTR
jgi:electron transfer flavoprotein alpha subunit